MNFFNIEKSYKLKNIKMWKKIFWMVDVHDTIFPGYYKENQPLEFYPFAKEVLQFLTKQEDTCLILYTCSHEHEINRMLQHFQTHDISFEFTNENKHVSNSSFGCYTTKPYFNILLEDKSGFEPSDWIEIKNILEKIYGETI